MLAGAKGKSLVANMPQERVLLETDGPFTQYQRSGLRPWDVNEACRMLAGVWTKEYAAAERHIRDNEAALLREIL
jgi:TatD DNase family protein